MAPIEPYYHSDDEESLEDPSVSTSSKKINDSTNTTGDSSTEDSPKIAKDETAAVFRLRVVVIIVLIITASVVSAVVLSITKRGEMDELKTQYEGAAYIVQVAFQDILEALSVISALGVIEEADAGVFPFQTLHNFNLRAANARYTTGALSIRFCPIVSVDKREDWEEYVNGPDSAWISSAYDTQEAKGLNGFETNTRLIEMSYITNNTVDPIKYFDPQGQAHVSLNNGPYLPIWQTSPILRKRILNQDILLDSADSESEMAQSAITTQQAILGSFVSAPYGESDTTDPTTSLFATYRSMHQETASHYLGDPLTYFYLPIFDAQSQVAAVLQTLLEWRGYFRTILKDSNPPVVVVLQNDCGGVYTYELQGQEAYILGAGDQHDPALDDWVREATFPSHHLRDGTVHGLNISQTYGCQYSIRIYPTQLFMDTYNTDTPLAITFAIAVVFVFTICMFVLYDRLVEQRQNIVMRQAAHTTAIVSSLFPKNVTKRLLAAPEPNNKERASMFSANKSRLKGFLTDTSERDANASVGGDASVGGGDDMEEQVIADFFPECTVFFSDIAGFTAWSSTREPEQVFVLLQTVYQTFDILAKRRKVFKVETIGDSYMAVTGLPEPMVNHAVTMVRFAWDCRNEFHRVTKELETRLGPDTADLDMRFGLNSGPVTAGVLRGDRARFQLFGDTVNTASRMESTGKRGMVQISPTTADLLRAAGKEAWLQEREDQVHAKGKGVLLTYWATPKSTHTASSLSSGHSSVNEGSLSHDQDALRTAAPGAQQAYKQVNQRLVDWMTDLLLDQTKKIIYSRRKSKDKPSLTAAKYYPEEGKTCLDEVKTEIEMPSFDAKITDETGREYRNVQIDKEVVENLREYVQRIAETYRDNPFHNFEHACHVTMSVNKLLKRIVTPELSHEEIEQLEQVENVAAHLHDYTHGINGDPLLSFAITISALIHDVDHRGVSNARLIEEEPDMATKYHDKSVAEQNSLDIAWDILMEDYFEDLRRVLFPTESDLMRFRQLIVNVVLATDIMDKELNGLRKRRWERAFSGEGKEEGNDTNLRATIVIEHIIQASDVSHTMQHWHIYRRWNERLFREVYKAYLDGRMEKDPSEGWYKGEIGFFDFYIIPLAKKLKECGVFGVSSDEYLSYAEQNRNEWELRGAEIVDEMLQKVLSDRHAGTLSQGGPRSSKGAAA